MNSQLPFRTQARTVDHLGREQIADSPTAISELWKNSYDAYARSVSLHIFDSPAVCAGIFDDGIGMDRSDFSERWLVLGTSSKVDTALVEQVDTKGLRRRKSQGQKGIGRLSVAFLGPLLFLVSRKAGSGFIASLIDWRLFENPYLLLEDVRIPFAEVSTCEEVEAAFAQLSEDLVDNVWGRNGTDERNLRVLNAWAKLDQQEKGSGAESLTSLQIVSAATDVEFSTAFMQPWSCWTNSERSGTALLVFQVKDELRVWLNPAIEGDEEARSVKANLQTTLTGFVDPFSDEVTDFDYRAVVHKGVTESLIVNSANQFGRQELHELEHYLDGRFDEFGTFSGRVRAFGRDLGTVTLPPVDLAPSTRSTRVGPFEFAIGTFEQDPPKSTHESAVHTALKAKAEESAGLRIYRDLLRIMPYGRPDVDFFGIEERRTLNAGREFWQHKRVFGRIALSREGNPNLRDKAGREGFIDNSARRRLRLLVIGLLMRTARQYFGSSSEYRLQLIPEIEAANRVARKSEAAVRSANLKEVLGHIRLYRAPLAQALNNIQLLQSRIQHARKEKDLSGLSSLASEVDGVISAKTLYRLPPRPARLNKAEDIYREYRDLYNGFAASVDSLTQSWAQASGELGSADPSSTAQRTLARYQTLLGNDISRWSSRIKAGLNAELISLQSRVDADRGAFYSGCRSLLEQVESDSTSLPNVLIEMDVLRERLHAEFEAYYVSYARGLERLAAGVDVDVALTWGAEARSELEHRVEQLNVLAQLGITVEIIGHEFETLDAQVSRNLKRLPSEVRQTDPYKLAIEAYQALTARLHFLTPLRIAGTQFRERISGASIADYVTAFFSQQFNELSIEFAATDAFKEATVTDFRYRIIPVFVNLVNNAIYWVRFATVREIKLDYVDGEMIVSDSGKGVDADDIAQLFEIFFTRRASGRGVGLYLCRANLAASGHKISYQTGGPSLSGANFRIDIASSSNA
jgi:signal transduction histidine kinase